MRILITGATGFVGKSLMKHLVNTSHTLIVLSRRTAESELYSSVEYIDIRKQDWMQQVKFSKPDIVIHLAAFLTSLDDEDSVVKLVEANILFGTQLLSALKNSSPFYFINTGTFAEYYNNDDKLEPAYLYAALKTAFRSVVQYYQSVAGFKTINVVPFTIYGGIDSKKKLIDYIYDSIKGDEWVNMSPGEQKLDFLHIEDVVSFYLTLIEQIDHFQGAFSEIRLGTGKGSTPKEIAAIFESLTGKQAKINWGKLPYRQRDTMYSVAEINLPQKYLNWMPEIPLEQGIKDYISTIEV